MPTIRELLEARNEIYVENAVTEDDLMRICFNKQVEMRDDKARAKKNRKKPKQITYLSKRDRDAVIMLAAVTQSLQNLIEDWDGLGNRPSFVLSWLRTAQTMCYKVVEWLIKHVPEKEYRKVLDDVAYYQIGIYEYMPKKRTEG